MIDCSPYYKYSQIHNRKKICLVQNKTCQFQKTTISANAQIYTDIGLKQS